MSSPLRTSGLLTALAGLPGERIAVGTIVAALAFSLGGRALAWYFSTVTTYTAVYGTFATLPLLLLWIYFSWIAVLVGAMIAAYLPALRARATRFDDYAGAEFLSAVQTLKQLYLARQAPDCGLPAVALSKRLRIDPLQLQELLTVLERLGWAGKVAPKTRGAARWALLCDPQTSGGLLLAVTPEAEADVQATAAEFGITLTAIGELVTARGGRPMIEIR